MTQAANLAALGSNTTSAGQIPSAGLDLSVVPLGVSQTWQNVSRASGTTYYNTTGRSIFGVAGFNTLTNNMSITLSINGGTALTIASNFSGGSNYTGASGAYIIPPGASYVLTFNNVNGYAVYTQELR